MPTLQHCIKCGEHIVVGDRFCAHCGAEQPSTLGAGVPERGGSRWDDIEKRLQSATEGRYHIRGLIGRGGMAAVYLADWPNMELRIAIKVMDPYLLDQETFVQRFLQEARTIAKLRHRHIIRVYDSGHAGDLFYFCMDYYPGRSMEKILAAEGSIPIDAVRLWLYQAADALGYAHRQAKPVVHRDVKPSNMLLDGEGDVVLTDFGIAKVRDMDQTVRSPSLTMPGSVLGTPAYLSPEQAGVILNPEQAPEGSLATSASDQYSLGVVGYEILCGEPPFSGDLAPLCVAHAEKPPPDILEKRPDCPPELAQTILRMLEKRPEDRWPHMEALCAALAVQTPPRGSPLRTHLVGLVRGQTPVGSISLAPPSGELFVGHTFKLDGTPLDLAGRPLPDRAISWKSSDPDIALITEDGLVQALRAGPVSITATADGVSGELRLAVSPVRVDTVVVLPSELAIPVGEEQILRTLLLSGDGQELSDRDISWTSNDPQVASVRGSGRIVAHQKGSTTIIASSEGRSGRARITVIPVPVAGVEVSPSTVRLEAGETGVVACLPRDAHGNSLEGRIVEWSVDDSSILTVLPDGTIRGVAAGKAVVSASIDGISGTAEVTVSPERATGIQLSPDPEEIQEGSTFILTAIPVSAKGKQLPDHPVQWTSSDPDIAEIGETGRVIGVAPGAAQITATCDDAVASVRINITPAPVAGLVLIPTILSLEAGESARLSASPRGTGGQTLPGRQVAWSSSDPAVVEVTGEGWATAVSAGQARVTAECEGQAASAEISVTPAPVAEIEVPEERITIEVGGTHTVQPLLRTKSGAPLEDREVLWESTAPKVAQVDSAGQVSALEEGEAEVLLTSEGATRSLRIVVVPARVTSMEVSPTSIEFPEHETVRLAVSLMARDGQPIEDRLVDWFSEDPAVAEVSLAGEVSGISPGTTTIRVECEDASSSVEVTVLPEPIALLQVQPEEVELATGEIVVLVGEARSESGRTLKARPVGWSSNDPAVAEVGENGSVTGKAPGSAIITGTCEGYTSSASVSVLPERVESLLLHSPKTILEIGEAVEIACQLLGTSGEKLVGRGVTWTSTAPGLAEIDAKGRVTAIAQGHVSIKASCEGCEASMDLAVSPPAVASVKVKPGGVSILPGESVGLEATVTDVNGSTVRDRPVTWTSSEERIAKIDADGHLTAVASGKATVAIACGGISTQIPVEVRPIPVRSVEIKPTKDHLKAKRSDQVAALVWGEDGKELEGRKVRWDSSDPAIAEVAPSGRVRGVKPGSAKITATCGDVSDSYLLTVDPPGGLPSWAPWGMGGLVTVAVVALGIWQLMGSPASESHGSTVIPVVVSLVLTPGDSVTVDLGGTLTFGITAHDDTGERVPTEAFPDLQWEVGDNAISSVSRAGVLTGRSPGVTQVTASLIPVEGSDPIEVTATVVVTEEAAARVAQVEMEGPGTLVEGNRGQISLVAQDSAGDELQGRTVEWNSSDRAVATVTGTGSSATVRALRPGSVEITATVEGVTGSHRFSISARPSQEPAEVDPEPTPAEPTVTSVRISPTQTELLEGVTVQLFLRDQDGNSVSGSFRVNDQTVATVTAQGDLTAQGAGSVLVTATYRGLEDTTPFTVVAAPPQEPDPTILESIRSTVQEARERAGESNFQVAYELLDRSGARFDSLLAQHPEAPSLGELYDWFIGEYRATTRDCELYVEALTGLPGVELPTCKQVPGGGPPL